jgi:1-acyl-sn-glycerol-3-phosphate acyltransferase
MVMLRPYFRAIAFLGLTLPLIPVQRILLWCAPSSARQLPHHYHRMVCRILGLRLRIEGVKPRGAVLLVSNHVSWADIPVLSGVLPVSFVAKAEVGSWLFFGTLARLQRSVFINRQRRHQTGKSRDELTERLKSENALVLFPEGTSHNGKQVLSFKSSYFGAVEQSEIPVVPVILAYRRVNGLPVTGRQRPSLAWYGDMDLLPHLWHFLKQGPVEVTVRFLEPLAPSNRKQLASAAEAQIRAGLVEILHGRP